MRLFPHKLAATALVTSVTLTGCFLDRTPADVPPTDGGADAGVECVANRDCVHLGAACLLGVCSAGRCVAEEIDDARACDDEDPCTRSTICSAGFCVGGSPVTCEALDDGQCLVGACRSEEGGCVAEPVADGTLCDFEGAGGVCAAGECGPCIEGMACVPESNACETGEIACGSGMPVCVSTGLAEPGVECEGGVCDGAGVCVPCVVGAECDSGVPCVLGELACETGAPVCLEAGDVDAGEECEGGVCDGEGACVPCVEDAPCVPETPECRAGEIACASGAPVCEVTGNAPVGTPCEVGVCNIEGDCVDCVPEAPCTPSTECRIGELDCTGPSLVCEIVGLAEVGDPCTGGVCNAAGDCISCDEGAFCNPDDDVCRRGAIACASGAPVCELTSNETAGESCGTNLVCDGSGGCVACEQGASCGDDPCVNESIDCSSGAPLCNVVDSNVAAGESCGTNLVCDGSGGCVACEQGASCGDDPCVNQATDCSSGAPVCDIFVSNVAGGESCGTDQVCDGAGACVACEAGASCGTNPCVNEVIVCSSGGPVCTPFSNVAGGESCGTNLVCDGSGGCVACEQGASCGDDPCVNQATDCSSGAPECDIFVSNVAGGESCGTNLVCDGSGGCVACEQGASCGDDPCVNQATDCSSGAPECDIFVSNVAAGESCGDGEVCDGAGECVSCGGSGEPCCPADTCESPHACVGDVCQLSPLADCQLNFDTYCPVGGAVVDPVPCGALFSGDGACEASAGSCAHTGSGALSVPADGTLTITLEGTIDAVAVSFTHAMGTSPGTMTFREEGGALVTTLSSNGPCGDGPQPRLSARFASPVATIEIAAPSGSAVFVDSLWLGASSDPLTVFATSETYFGAGATDAVSGVSGANGSCARLAGLADLCPGSTACGEDFASWIASDDTDAPFARFRDGAGLYETTTTDTIAGSFAELLEAPLASAISRDENGASITGEVWTGVAADGTSTGIDCDGWATAAVTADGTAGDSTADGSGWTDEASRSCLERRRLYCFEQAPAPTIVVD